MNLSSVLFAGGRIDEAEGLALRALALAEAEDHWSGAGHAHRVLGEICASTGRWEEGLSHLSRSTFLLERSGEATSAGAAHCVLGQLLYDVGEARRAVASFSLARQRFRRVQDVEGEFRAIRGLARCYGEIDEVETALTFWERALELPLAEEHREGALREARETAARLRPDRRREWTERLERRG